MPCASQFEAVQETEEDTGAGTTTEEEEEEEADGGKTEMDDDDYLMKLIVHRSHGHRETASSTSGGISEEASAAFGTRSEGVQGDLKVSIGIDKPAEDNRVAPAPTQLERGRPVSVNDNTMHPGAYAVAPTTGVSHSASHEPDSVPRNANERQLVPQVRDNKLVEALPVTDEAEEMPNANEYDQEAAAMRRIQHKRTKCSIGVLFLHSALAIIIAIVVLFATKKKHNQAAQRPTSVGPSASPSEAHTTPQDEFMLTLLPQATIDAIFTDDTSPQCLAFQWLIEDPNFINYSPTRLAQRFALATFFYSTGGPKEWHDYMSKGWLNYSLHECDWAINQNPVSGTMNNTLRGELWFHPPQTPCENTTSPHIYTHLWVPDANLVGEIPPEVFLLTDLIVFNVQENKNLVGGLPTQVGLLSNLQHLNLGQMTVMDGPVPSEIGTCMSLQSLVLPNSTGTLPTTFGRLQELQYLFAWGTRLSGSIPSQIGLLDSLLDLHLVYSQFTGSIPEEMWGMSSLELLDLRSNQLTGTLSTKAGTMSNLFYFAVQFNQFSSSIPSEIGNLSTLHSFLTYDNQMTGALPTQLGKLQSIVDLSLSGNLHNQSIPTQLGQLSTAAFLNLCCNQLAGRLPSELGLMSNMADLQLHQNPLLAGSIPSEFGQLTKLKYLYLKQSGLNGRIPTEIGLLEQIWVLSIWENRFTGLIPSQIGLLSSAYEIYLDDNQLTGRIPSEMGGLENLLALHLMTNDLTGTVPEEVCGYEGHADFRFDCAEYLCGCSSCVCSNMSTAADGMDVFLP